MQDINVRWGDLCKKINEDFIDGIQCHRDKIEVRVSKWKITLDTSVMSSGKVSCDLTSLRARYMKLDNFKFNIYRKSSFDKFIDFFMETRKSSSLMSPKYKANFIVKSNDKYKMDNLLSNDRIMKIIESEPFMVFEISDDKELLGQDIAKCMSEISIKLPGVVTDPDRLKNLFELISEVLKQLCMLKSAA